MFDLGGLPVSDLALSSLQVLTNLEHLDLWGSKISDEGAATFKKFPKLSFLSLAWTNVTKLPNLKSLKCLDMINCSIHSVTEDSNDKATLKQIIVTGASFLDAGEVFSSIDASCLSFLNLSNTSLSYGFLLHMHVLEHLDLSSNLIQDDAVEAIAHVGANLRHLNLDKTEISSAGVKILVGHVPNREVLSLSLTPVDDIAIVYMSMMPSLKAVNLSHSNIEGFIRFVSDDPLEEVLILIPLQDLKHLESLDLEGTFVSDETLHALRCFEQLRHLSLGSAPLTDSCLDYLSSMKKLSNLSIQVALLTNGFLDSFKPPGTLEVLDLRGCRLLTMEALTSFCEAHPGIKVRHDLLSTTLIDHDDSHPQASSSQKGSSSVKSKEKHRRSIMSPLFKKDILDQRIKYGREELLALQHLSSPFVPPPKFDAEVLKVD